MRHVTVQQLSAFIDGALTGVSRDLVTRHLQACASCRERHARWRIYDQALQRVLSWEPDERTLEEWSSRAELALTADRKGLPAPEFTSTLAPGVAAAGAGAHAATSASATVAPPPHPSNSPQPSGPPHLAGPPHLTGSPHLTGPPEPVGPAPHARVDEIQELPESQSIPVGASSGRAAEPEAEPAPPWDMGAIQRGHPMRSLLKVALVVLLAAILLSPFLPEVIRVHVHPGWMRLPRFEFVHAGDDSTRSSTSVAASSVPEPAPVVPPPAPPAPPPAVDSSALQPPKLSTAESDAAAARAAREAKRAARRAAKKKPLALPIEEPIAQETSFEREHTATVIPVTVTTSVELSSPATRDSAAEPAHASPAPEPAAGSAAPPGEPAPAWSLLCGEVVDESGAGIEGARVQLEAPVLITRTDHAGKFCLSCPVGKRTLRVEIAGHGTATREVELVGASAQVRIALPTTH